MKQKNFLSFIGVSAMIFMLAFSAGGCGGSGGSVQEGYDPNGGGGDRPKHR
ncbi:MAG: hypothetical protein IJ697_00910 [Synergistaceae bacterium]|nr:hypothetical protein [Synergistaceae bacterium]